MPPKRKAAPATRRSSRNSPATSPVAERRPADSKKRKPVVGDVVKTRPKEDDAELSSPGLEAVSPKKPKPGDDKDEKEEEKRGRFAKGKGRSVNEAAPPTDSIILSRSIVVEACTQCKSFKERADKVKKGLESAISDISVQINPQKPRRGYFEIREERTEVIISLPSMNRPFTPMKQLDMDKVVEDLIKRCSN